MSGDWLSAELAAVSELAPLAPELPEAPELRGPDDAAKAPPEAAAPDVVPALVAPPELEPKSAWLLAKAPPPAPVEPDAATPDANAAPEAPDPDTDDEPLAAPPPVEPEDTIVFWEAGPDAPDIPPVPVPVTLVLIGFEEAGPLTPPVPVALVVDPPLGPEEALPLDDPVDEPVEPPVEVPVAGPLLPLPVEVPVPVPDPLLLVAAFGDAEATAAAGAAAAWAGAGPLFRAATIARPWSRPVMAGNGTPSGAYGQQFPPEWDHSDHGQVPRPTETGGAFGPRPGSTTD